MRVENILTQIQKGNTRSKEGSIVRGKLVGYRFYGFIQSVIPEDTLPSYIKRLKKNDTDIWVSMQLMATGKSKEIERNRENTYFSGGSVAILVPRTLHLNDWYQVEGVARTVLYDGTGDCCYISNMAKLGGVWGVIPSFITDLDLGSVSKTIERYIVLSAEKGLILLPSEALESSKIRAYEVRYEDKVESVRVATPESIGESVLNINEMIERYVEEDSIEEDYYDDVDGLEDEGELPSNSIEWREVKRRRYTKFNAIGRTEKIKKPEKFNKLNKIADKAVLVREKTFEGLEDIYDTLDDDIYESNKTELMNLIQGIKNSAHRRPMGVGLSGQAIIKEYIEKHEESQVDIDGVTLAELILYTDTSRICEYMLYSVGISEPTTLGLPLNSDIQARLTIMFPSDINILYAGLYAVIMGFKPVEFKKTAEVCSANNLSFIEIVKTNPYLLILANDNMKFLTLETLANARGLQGTNENWRLACMLHDMLNNDSGSTAFDMYRLYTTKLNYSVGKLGLRRLKTEYSLITECIKASTKYYIDSKLEDKDWNYDSSSFNEYGVKYLSKEELKRAFIAYVDIGLGTTDRGYLYNTSMLKKEIFIFDKLYRLSYRRADINRTKIETSIKEFENEKNKELGISQELIEAGKGFKFEELQADAVRMIDQNVACVTGPAGSGKTTTVEAMIYARKKQNPKKKLIIKYAAPTGKAAKRLQETVKTKVRTIHAMFNIFGGDSEIEVSHESKSNRDDTDIYIFDELAMADTNLMYKMLQNMGNNSQIFFLGDIEQLPAIGRGKPFADILRFLPTVVLKVSKRSTEGSDITLNTKRIIENSDKYNFEELTSGRDFKLLPAQDKDIPDLVIELCKHHMGLDTTMDLPNSAIITNKEVLKEEDIQIISPVNKERYNWGCDKLNVLLQDLFNPIQYTRNYSVTYGYSNNLKTLRVGSRVIHTENQYGYCHYKIMGHGQFKPTNKGGVLNGDMGYIVGVFDGEECRRVEPDMEIEDTFEGHEIIEIHKFFKKGYIIVAVQYYDPEEEDNYIILYHGKKSEVASTPHEAVLSFTNLNKVQLAYALTTHKMQGSEAKLIICVVGSYMSPQFVNRNMVYTMVSRAREGCYVVGDIRAIEKGRLFESVSDRTTAMEQICIG